MNNNELLLDDITNKVLYYIWESIDNLNFKYVMILICLMIITVIISIFTRISLFYNRRVNDIGTITNNEIPMVADDEKIIFNKFNKIKTKIMIDHTQYLRDLHVASERCYIKKNAMRCIQILSYCPHLVNVKDGRSGMTPFHNVCCHGHTVLVTFMLAKGANPWLRTDVGETALCLAIQACIKNQNEPLTCIEVLQNHGCYLDHTDKWYRIYLEAALLTNNKPLVKWMFNQASLLGNRCASFPLTRI